MSLCPYTSLVLSYIILLFKYLLFNYSLGEIFSIFSFFEQEEIFY